MNAVDTNVLIYACDQSKARQQRIALELIGGLTDGVLVWQVVLEFVAACLDAGVTRPYSEDLPGRAPPPGLEIVNPFA